MKTIIISAIPFSGTSASEPRMLSSSGSDGSWSEGGALQIYSSVNQFSLTHSTRMKSQRCVTESVCSSYAVPLGGLQDGNALVLEERLEEQTQSSHHTHDHEDPQEQAVHHHGHILPVLDDLDRGKLISTLNDH